MIDYKKLSLGKKYDTLLRKKYTEEDQKNRLNKKQVEFLEDII